MPRIMICHLAMNVTRNLNLFPAKGVVSAHYIPHIILPQRNWNYNKHFQVESCAYVKSSQDNDPKNNNHPRKLDGIYLFPAPNLQGVHQIMDLSMGRPIKTTKVLEIPITYVLINTVEKLWRSKDLSH